MAYLAMDLSEMAPSMAYLTMDLSEMAPSLAYLAMDLNRELPAPSLSSSVPSDRIEVKSEKVRRFHLSGIGSVSKSLGRLGSDTDAMPPESQKRSRPYPAVKQSIQRGHPRSAIGQSGQDYVHCQPARRSTTFTSHPPLRPTALHSADRQRKIRNSTSTMDYMPSPERFCTPNFLKSTLSASPSSLYMYDQDRPDPHPHLHDPAKPTLTQGGPAQDVTAPPPAEPDFDLNPQFENSNNLEGFFGGALGAGMTSGSFMDTSLGFQSGSLKQELMPSPQADGGTKPAPPEVNVDPYLFGEDSDSGVFGEARRQPASLTSPHRVEDGDSGVFSEARRLQPASLTSPHRVVESIKKEMSLPLPSEAGPKTFTPLRTVKTSQSPAAIVRLLQQHSQASSGHPSPASFSDLLTSSRAQRGALASPVPTFTIKTEPADSDRSSGDSNSYLHKMLTSPSQQSAAQLRSPPSQPPRQCAEGQSRPPSLGQQGKSGSVEEKWKEIEKFIHDPDSEQPPRPTSARDRKRKRHGSGESTIMSDEESVKSQRRESITDDDSDSDEDSDVSDTPFEESLTELARRNKQFFWQYNTQAKGPKGTRLHLTIHDNDPHRPGHFEDPVFDPTNTRLVGIRHGGKARKGDGNEISPNPRKLYMIGQKLCRLTREINGVHLAGDLPPGVRSQSRREKNKLSSRACRLKKKAQHEANKIKLFGLNCEQGELLDVVQCIWPKLKERVKQMKENLPFPSNRLAVQLDHAVREHCNWLSSLTTLSENTAMKENLPFPSNRLAVQLDHAVREHCKTRIAGSTADYVNQAVARVEEGDPAGGLAIKVKVKGTEPSRNPMGKN
ncbi:hypothetical protein ACOMHN_005485 [Nucella lapillus]